MLHSVLIQRTICCWKIMKKSSEDIFANIVSIFLSNTWRSYFYHIKHVYDVSLNFDVACNQLKYVIKEANDSA